MDLLVVLDLLLAGDLAPALDLPLVLELLLGTDFDLVDVVVSAAPYSNAHASARTAADRRVKTSNRKNEGQAVKPAQKSESAYCAWFGSVPSAHVDDHC